MKRTIVSACLGVAIVTVADVASGVEASDYMLEEIVVTAQRSAESLQETPISLTTFGSEKLEKEGINNLADIASKVPSLTMEPFPTNNATLRIFIRGVGLADAQITQDPPVGVYLDGVYIARSTGLALDVAELERIEVLRGPQGTLYGRNSTGGAINLITSRPNSESLTFSQQLTGGNRGLLTSKTRLNVPLGDTLAIKLAYLNSRQNGFVKNTGPGENFGDREVEGYRLDLRWDISERWHLDYAYDRGEIEFVNYPYQPVLPPDTTPASNSPGDLINAQLAAQAQNFVEYSNRRRSRMATPLPMQASLTKIEGHMLSLEWDLHEALQVKYLAARRELYDLPYAELSGGSQSPDYRIDGAEYTSRDGSVTLPQPKAPVQQEQWSHELQFAGSAYSRLEYIAGLYYFEESADVDTPRSHQFTGPLNVTDTPTATTTVFLVQTSGGAFSIDNRAWAAFSRVTWTPPILDNRLHLTLGARYSEDRRKATKTVDNATLTETETRDKITGQRSATPPDTINAVQFSAIGDNHYADDSYELIAEYEFQDQINVYAKYSEAYKSGGYNTREPNEAFFKRGFDKEKVAAYELGIKGEWLNRRLRINSSVFYSEYTDMQLNFKIPGGIADSRVVNAGEAEMSGLETDITLLATPTLLLGLNHAYLDAKVVSASDPFTGEDASDEYIFSSAPEHSYSATLDWTIAQFNLGRLGLNLSYNYMDDRNGSTRTDISELIFLPSYDLLNARLGLYNIPLLGGALTVAAWGKNLTDTEYEINGLAALPHARRAVIWGEPRAYGLDAIYRY